ncbi:hypothetical protein ACG873_01795 (plasmid) [Mesorhizobium sp. AaZ16]|uniref:hypothetical protein n=1 Tax=Mesorhizobium sp. AaZ16 TaxID=3402289 RepID=UPI00374EBB9A
MRAASIVAFVLFAVLAARAEGPADHLLTNGVGSLFSNHSDMAGFDLAVIVRYAAAMKEQRTVNAAGNPTGRLKSSDESLEVDSWIWFAASGDFVRRKDNRTFQVVRGNSLGNWFTEFECEMHEWPLFLCTDGTQRKMSAPDTKTMVFDGVEYKRFLHR